AFPRYETFSGSLVKKYLAGGFGSLDELPPEFPSLLYALDRYDAAKSIEESLAAGKIVVADRFTASNIAHQAVKLPKEEQQDFIEWLKGVESRLPKSTITVYLDVPVEISQGLMESEGREKDLHEQNPAFLKRAQEIYLSLAKQSDWERINCVKDEKLLSIEEIHEMVWKAVGKHI
ncbi:MAG: thymidylate kinase, partial [archaeon]|nr:thymidylate kinase [archaeon]